MPLTIDWSLVASIPGCDTASGICNIGGGKMRAVLGTGSAAGGGGWIGQTWESEDDGRTWRKSADLDIFSDLGISGEDWTAQTSGLLCYKPGVWLHAEDGAGASFDDGGGILRVHPIGDSGAGVPTFNQPGWSQFGRPCLTSRKDVANSKFAIWPGAFLFDLFGPSAPAAGTLLLELTAGGKTSLTTAFLMNELTPGGNPAAYGSYPDGSPIWVWVTQPPAVGSSTGLPSGLYTDGWFFFMMATFDGAIWRPYGDNQAGLAPGTRNASFGGTSYNYLGEAFFLSDGETLLLGVNVSGLSPCIFRSTARGLPGSLKEVVMPGNFFNFVPEGALGTFIFSGLYVMTHCFCELDDGTVLCAGGAPTVVGPQFLGLEALGYASIYGSEAFHYPVVWRSTNKGVSWENISLNVEGSDGAPLEAEHFYEGRCLLSLGGQSALLVCLIYAASDPNWTPFFITEDGGNTFRKSAPSNRVGMFTMPRGSMNLAPGQVTFANDGSVLVIMARWDDAIVEIWRGVPSTSPAQLEHRAVGFVEHAAPEASSFVAASIPEQELIRG